MSKRDMPYKVLFLCTGSSARSILGESILNAASDRFEAHSAGSQPTGAVNPYALELLEQLGFGTGHCRSKSWDEFSGADAPTMDFIFTVCDSAAGESCPIWPGHPLAAHWGMPDPAAVQGSDSDKRLAFSEAHRLLSYRIGLFIDLPVDLRDRQTLRRRLREIGAATTNAVKK